VIDNAIVLDAIAEKDESDSKSIESVWEGLLSEKIMKANLKGRRFGAPQRFMEDSLFIEAIEVLKNQGAEVLVFDELEISLPNFLHLLNLDMKKDLPAYFNKYADESISYESIDDIIAFNLKDSLRSMPYGQSLFVGISEDKGDELFLERIKDTLKTNGRAFLNRPMDSLKLDGILSINNRHAGYAAVAEYPALTVPMGYSNEGEPKGLTFITKPLGEKELLEWAYAYEQTSKKRKAPELFN